MSTTAEKKLKFGRWEKLQVGGAVPSVRFAHSSVVVVRDATMYVFGGSSYGSHEDTEYHNDMYRLKRKTSTPVCVYHSVKISACAAL